MTCNCFFTSDKPVPSLILLHPKITWFSIAKLFLLSGSIQSRTGPHFFILFLVFTHHMLKFYHNHLRTTSYQDALFFHWYVSKSHKQQIQWNLLGFYHDCVPGGLRLVGINKIKLHWGKREAFANIKTCVRLAHFRTIVYCSDRA